MRSPKSRSLLHVKGLLHVKALTATKPPSPSTLRESKSRSGVEAFVHRGIDRLISDRRLWLLASEREWRNWQTR